MVNFAVLRDEAYKQLKRRGQEPFTALEARYIGHRLATAIGVYKEVGESDLDVVDKDPLMRELVELVDQRAISKWVWLVTWLSYNHAAMQHPDAMSDIALYLLGMTKIPTEIQQKLLGLI